MSRWWLFSAAAFLVVFLDRVTKLWVLKSIAPKGVVKVTSFFNLVYVTNTGAAFGVGRGGDGRLFVVASVVAMLVVLALVRKIKEAHPVVFFSLGMVFGGGLGNLWDRLYYGSVIDFLDFHLGKLHWPAFNVADSAVVVGVILFALLYKGKREQHASVSD